jgi:hypothetical protein
MVAEILTATSVYRIYHPSPSLKGGERSPFLAGKDLGIGSV